MPLPIFLRPLLLIQYYWQTFVYTLNQWLQRSNDELFGPLEQVIVAVVITGIAMNPSMVMNMGGPVPMPVPVSVPYPIPVPQYHPGMDVPAARPVATPPSPSPINETASSTHNDTTTGSGAEPDESANTGHRWLDILLNLFPPSYRPNPITIALLIMLMSLLIHIAPNGFIRRMKESWVVFWPPWQDRSTPSRSSTSVRAGESRSRDAPVPEVLKARASSSEDGAAKAKVEGSQSRSVAEVKPSDSDIERPKEKEKERAKRKALALAEYEAKKATSGSTSRANPNPNDTAEPVKAQTGPSTTTAVQSDGSVTQSEKAQAIKDDTPPNPKSDKKVTIIDPDSAASTIATTGLADPNDPLMAGDYRPLRSVLKKSTKKPRQSKNTHHNLFMTMRGHQPHLIPFPHGLHPPPHEARHTLWWKNIPKESRHLMAPPQPPKAVKDETEEDEDGAKVVKVEVKVKEDGIKEAKVVVDDEKGDGKESKVKPTESEIRAKVKEKEAEKKPSTASAVAKIEFPEEPDIPVDPQVQKATWASQAMLCLLLFHIQQQLGLILLAFFAWQQLNTHTERVEKIPKTRPVAVAEAVAEAPPVKRKEDEIPREMREKLDRAERHKSENPTEVKVREIVDEKSRGMEKEKGKDRGGVVTVEDVDDDEKPKVEKGKGKERATSGDPGGSAGIKLKEKMEGMSPEDRKKYDRYLKEREEKAKEATTRLQTGSQEAKTKAEPRVLSKSEKEAYYQAKVKAKAKAEAEAEAEGGNIAVEDKDREIKTRSSTATAGDKGKEKMRTFEDLTDEEKKKYLREREKRKLKEAESGSHSATKRAEGSEKKKRFEDLTDDEKRRYLREREKRKAKEAERARRGSRGEGGSGLTASEKEKL